MTETLAWFAVYTSDGFLTWNDERSREETTSSLIDAALFRSAREAWHVAKRVNGCVVRDDGLLLTVAEVLAS